MDTEWHLFFADETQISHDLSSGFSCLAFSKKVIINYYFRTTQFWLMFKCINDLLGFG